MENRFKRYLRYTKYILQWVFMERLRGLDFTMRDTSLLKQSGGVLHGYSKTDEKHAKKIFERIHVSESKKIIDIGCGKGAFLREASKYPFGKIAGIEYDERIASVAERNFTRLGLSDRVKIYTGDARSFNHYDKYNVFYFFNPFDADIMKEVLIKIMNNQKEKICVILHHPTCEETMKEIGVREICKLYDPVKSYETIIYELEKSR